MSRSGLLFAGLTALAVLMTISAGSFGPTPLPTWFFVGVAGFAGFGLGFYISPPAAGISGPVEVRVKPNPAGVVPDSRPAIAPVSHPLETVEGIGRGYGNRLRELGVPDTLELLRVCAQAEKRAELAGILKIEPLVVQRWTSMADLLRIHGMDGQSAEVLEAAGVTNISVLERKGAAELVGVLFEVNERFRLTPGALPSVDQLENWIGLAGVLPPIVDDL